METATPKDTAIAPFGTKTTTKKGRAWRGLSETFTRFEVSPASSETRSLAVWLGLEVQVLPLHRWASPRRVISERRPQGRAPVTARCKRPPTPS